MAREVRKKCVVIGIGLVLYVNALFSVRLWEISTRTRMVLFLLPFLVMSVGIFLDMVKNYKRLQIFSENLLMLVATVGAFLIGRYTEAVAAILFFQFGRMVELISMTSTKKSIAEFMDIRPQYANRKIRGREERVHPRELKPRQIIIIKPGERMPADGVVTRGAGLVDTKALTGESQPREVKIGDRVYSGSINISGVLEARVSKVFAESTVTKIMALVENANNNKAQSEKFADRFSRFYTPVVTMLGILVMILPPMMFSGASPQVWLYRGLIFLVAACPCGLLVSVPLAFLGGIGAASRQGVLIKGSDCLEALSQTETFVFDKTGTLTRGVFHVRAVCPRTMKKAKLLELTACAEFYSNHPIAVSLREAYKKTVDSSRIGPVKEYSGFGVCAFVDGSEVLIGNGKLMNQQGLYCPPVREIGTAVHVGVNGQYEGYILIADVVRPDAKRTVRWLQKHQFEIIMLTGDNQRVADSVAKELGMDYVCADLMPEEKVEQVRELMEIQMESEKLAVVGDGINDAPVLALADIGIAMGGLGADAALEAADVILMEDEPSRIINAIRISRETIRAVKQNLVFAIGMKVFLLFLAALGYVTMQNAIIADMAVMLINILNSFWVLKYPE